MSLSLGARLGHYEIAGAIGKGGMGEVWRARDSKLGREVAIKTLPEEFAQDEQRLARFEREAKLLGSLNHPNIATIHGLEEHNGQQFLVMELVEGETLAERIEAGPVPVGEAIPLFVQIAEGLEVAHEKGVIHRDLKPANIKITPDNKVKILDFGLAKAFAPQESEIGDSSQSPTLTKGTALGVIMGTASYMSPEQARGKPSTNEPTSGRSDVVCMKRSLARKRSRAITSPTSWRPSCAPRPIGNPCRRTPRTCAAFSPGACIPSPITGPLFMWLEQMPRSGSSPGSIVWATRNSSLCRSAFMVPSTSRQTGDDSPSPWQISTTTSGSTIWPDEKGGS